MIAHTNSLLKTESACNDQSTCAGEYKQNLHLCRTHNLFTSDETIYFSGENKYADEDRGYPHCYQSPVNLFFHPLCLECLGRKKQIYLFFQSFCSLCSQTCTWRQCFMPVLPWKHMPEGSIPCVSRAAEGCDAQLPWPAAPGSSSTAVTESPLALLPQAGAHRWNSDGLHTTPRLCNVQF